MVENILVDQGLQIRNISLKNHIVSSADRIKYNLIIKFGKKFFLFEETEFNFNIFKGYYYLISCITTLSPSKVLSIKTNAIFNQKLADKYSCVCKCLPQWKNQSTAATNYVIFDKPCYVIFLRLVLFCLTS